MKFSIVTAVRNDKSGVVKTLRSSYPLCLFLISKGVDVSIFVQDGLSTDDTLDAVKSFQKDFLISGVDFNLSSQCDKSHFDAMHIATSKLSHNSLVVYMNAGDVFHPQLNLDEFYQELYKFDSGSEKLLFLRSCNTFQDEFYYMPGKNVVNQTQFRSWVRFNTPVHQAVIFKVDMKFPIHYRLDWEIMSDSYLIYYLTRFCDFKFSPIVFCEFELGGLSGDYRSASKVFVQISEQFIISKLRDEPFISIFGRLSSLLIKYLITKALGYNRFLTFHMTILKWFKS